MPARPLAIANRSSRLQIDRRALAAAIATLDAHADQFDGGCPPGELSIVFLSDAALAKLHADFLSDPSLTDVITFAAPRWGGANDEAQPAGEICVSVDAAWRQTKSAQRSRRRLADFSAELMLYVVHGWLHLAGYDDLQPAKKRLMRRAEARAFRFLLPQGKPAMFRLSGAARNRAGCDPSVEDRR